MKLEHLISIVITLQCLTPGLVPAAEATSLAEHGWLRPLVSAGLGAEDTRYHARAKGEGFLLPSPAQGLVASFQGGGVEVRGSGGSVGMRLLSWGCESSLADATARRSGALANRVELAWDGITEWYVAGPLGVEQGFTVEAPGAGCEAARDLVIELRVVGSALLGGDRRSLRFPAAGLRYRGLVAFDASGRELPARLELAGQRLTIRTVVADVRWPVTVDPTFETAKLLPADGAINDRFGESVAFSGNTVVVGADSDDDNGNLSGSAYVFTEPVGGWAGTLTQAAKLLPADGAAGNFFGGSVAVSGSTVVVGSAFDDDNGTGSGSAYVFTEPVGGWAGTLTQAAKLLPADGDVNDRFGISVAVSGSTVIIGSDSDDDNGGQSGSAYVFTEPVGGWAGTLTEAAKLLASDGGGADFFGSSVAVSGSAVVVGVPFDDDGGTSTGSAYVFTEPVGGWAGTVTEAAKLLASDGTAADFFGSSVAISGGTVVCSADSDDDNGKQSGSAYVFTKPVGGWAGAPTEAAKLLASDGDVNDRFGMSVAVSGGTVAVGVANNDDSGNQSGSAYLFTEPVGGWAGTLTEAVKLLASDAAADDHFGFSVAVSGSDVVVGAFGDDDNGLFSGSAYVFGQEIITGPGELQFVSTTFSVGEGDGMATVAVSRDEGSDGSVSVDYSTADGSATAGSDYAATFGTLAWSDGDAANKFFDVPIFDDGESEPAESVSLSLADVAGGASLGSPSEATLTLNDNDGPMPCDDAEFSVCLLDRFLVTIHFETNDGSMGDARAFKLTDSAASFEFFEVGNVEIVVKMKDTCTLPDGHPLRNFWVFIAGLTNVRVEITIVDTVTGTVRKFINQLNQPFFTPAPESTDGQDNPPGAIQATTAALGAFPTCDM